MALEKRTLEEWLDDLSVRFIINLPQEDLSAIPRICFHIEEAQWFYEDFIRSLDPSLPSMQLRAFSLRMFQHCPLFASFSTADFQGAFEEFQQYKTRVPVRGVIMLNPAMDSAVLVRGWKKGASWSFPRGKIAKDETDLDCAIRETLEETGYDLNASGLIERNQPVQHLDVTMKGQQVRLFVIRDVPEDTIFQTMTRKEIGDIKWYRLSELPAFRKKKAVAQDKFYMVAPFMVPLREWIRKQQKGNLHQHPLQDEGLTDDNMIIQEPPKPTSFNPEHIQTAEQKIQRMLQVVPPVQGVQAPVASDRGAQYSENTVPGPEVVRTEQMFGSGTLPQAAAVSSVDGDSAKLKALLQKPFAGASATSAAPAPVYQDRSQRTLDEASPPLQPPMNLQPFYYPPDPKQMQGYTMASQGNDASAPFQHQLPSGFSYQSQARPHVEVPVHNPGQYAQPQSHRRIPSQSLPLLHPQPLPPQALKDMRARDSGLLAPNSPQVPPPPQAMLQNMFNMPQMQPGPAQGAKVTATQHSLSFGQTTASDNGMPRVSAQGNKLLDIFKTERVHHTQPESSGLLPVNQGTTSVMSTQEIVQRGSPASQSQGLGQLSGRQQAAPNSRQQMPSTFGSGSPLSGLTRQEPSSQHRTNLLDMFKKDDLSDMFKKTDLSSMKPELDGQALAGSSQTVGSLPAQSRRQSGSTGAPSGAARDNGRQPMMMNPDTYLPYGASSILSRPRQGSSKVVSPVAADKGPSRQFPRAGSQSSPRFSQGRPSPLGLQNTQAPISELPAHSPLARPSYGSSSNTHGTPQGSMGNQGYMAPSPASNAPYPGVAGVKSRQNSSAEHQNALLSLFQNKSQQRPGGGLEDGKANELAAASPDAFGYDPVPAPRSRLASVAQSTGEPRSGPSSRRGSQKLAPEQQAFLLSFLNDASNNPRR